MEHMEKLYLRFLYYSRIQDFFISGFEYCVASFTNINSQFVELTPFKYVC